MNDNGPRQPAAPGSHARDGVLSKPGADSLGTPEAVIPKVMSAVAYNRYGGPEVLDPVMAPTPRARAAQVLVRVHAASVNPIDYRIRQGELRWVLPGGFPRIPGFDIAGEVVVPSADNPFASGDRVFACLDSKYGGGYAEYAACSAACVAKIPDHLSYEQAAAIPLAASTALQSLRDHGAIRAGDRVLIIGASGGVGGFAVQIAKSFGAHVTALASGEHEAFVRSLGADTFIDRLKDDFTQASQRWDLIFDAAGKSNYFAAREVLASGGHYVSTEPSLWGGVISVASTLLSKRGRVMLVRSSGRDLESLAALSASGHLRVDIQEVFPLDHASAAHRKLEQGTGHGKIVLSIG